MTQMTQPDQPDQLKLKKHNRNPAAVSKLVSTGELTKLIEYTNFSFGRTRRPLFKKIINNASPSIVDHVFRNISSKDDTIMRILVILIHNHSHENIEKMFDFGLIKRLSDKDISRIVNISAGKRAKARFVFMVEILILKGYIKPDTKLNERHSILSHAINVNDYPMVEMLMKHTKNIRYYRDNKLDGGECGFRRRDNESV